MSVMATLGPEGEQLIRRIGKVGFGVPFVRKMIPDWWSPEVEMEPGSVTELKIRLSRRLGIDLGSLLGDGAVSLAIPQTVKFKRAVRISETDVSAPFMAYCSALAHNIAACMSKGSVLPLKDAADERKAILSDQRIRWISLGALLRRSWTENHIAVVQVVDAPLITRGFDAATFRIGEYCVVILAKRHSHPAWAAFVLAHELGHLGLRHIGKGETLLDESSEPNAPPSDEEENAANKYALTLLGGAGLEGVRVDGTAHPVGLEKTAMSVGTSHRIDPGHLILRFARESGEWDVAQAALARLSQGEDIAVSINSVAERYLDYSNVGEEARAAITEALGI